MYAEDKCAAKEKKSSTGFTKKCNQVFSSLVRSKHSSKPPASTSSSKKVQEFNFLVNSTPNIVHAINSGVFHMEEEAVMTNQPEITFSPLTKRSSSACASGEDRRHRKYRCNSLSSKLQKSCIIVNGNASLKTPKSERLRQRNEPVVEQNTDQPHYDTPPGIGRTHRSNSAHALANSMYLTYSAGSRRQPNQQIARNSMICANIPHQSPEEKYCDCHAYIPGQNSHQSCSLNHYDQLKNYCDQTPEQGSTTQQLHTSFSSQSLPRRRNTGKLLNSSTTTTTAPNPTTENSSSASCVGTFDLNESTVDRHRRQAQLTTNQERGTRSPGDSMYFGTSDVPSGSRIINKASTPIGSNPNYSYLSSSQQPYFTPASSQSRTLNSSFIGAPEHPSRYNLVFYWHSAVQRGKLWVSGTKSGENVFNADYPSAGAMSSYPVDSKHSMRKKTKSSNKLSSVFGRHSKVLTSSTSKEAAHNAAWSNSIDHQNYSPDKSSNQLDSVLHSTSPNNNSRPLTASYESNSIVLYNSQNHPTTIDHPSCSNTMSRSSSTQGFIGREYFDAPQLYAGNHLMVDPVRRSTNNQELTEPIIVLAKQLGNKEVEIDRLKSQLNRRSSRNESRLAQYEDELSYSRDQASKLKTKLRLCEAECAAIKAKKEELEKRLETITTNYENKLENMERENANHRKEFTRLKELEEAYEKYLDEKDWIEKHTDSLNQKLDENESSLHLSEQECQHLKLELERLKDCLKDKEAEIAELTSTSKTTAISSESEEEELLLTGIQKCSLKEMKRRGKSHKQSTPKPVRPNVLLTPTIPTSKSCSGLHLARSCSSTPDSVNAPASITSSGVSSFAAGSGRLGSEHNHLSVSKQMQRCHKKMNDCQRRVTTLLEATQRMANGGRPTKNDIIGSASESETSDLFDYDQLNSEEGGGLNERAMEKALETHCSQISQLYQNIEALHGSLLAAYGRNNRQELDGSKNPNSCRVH
uniref:Uncharacterized protein n=1 Tax=Ditylenchus dipsaci TaxID=166011 RepID=A0A915DA52_9BILA